MTTLFKARGILYLTLLMIPVSLQAADEKQSKVADDATTAQTPQTLSVNPEKTAAPVAQSPDPIAEPQANKRSSSRLADFCREHTC